jgi:hypothetical protein
MPLLATFTSDLHRSTIQVQFADEQLCALMRARTGVVQKQQQCVISTSLIGRSVGAAKCSGLQSKMAGTAMDAISGPN